MYAHMMIVVAHTFNARTWETHPHTHTERWRDEEKKKYFKKFDPDVLIYACNPSTEKAE